MALAIASVASASGVGAAPDLKQQLTIQQAEQTTSPPEGFQDPGPTPPQEGPDKLQDTWPADAPRPEWITDELVVEAEENAREAHAAATHVRSDAEVRRLQDLLAESDFRERIGLASDDETIDRLIETEAPAARLRRGDVMEIFPYGAVMTEKELESFRDFNNQVREIDELLRDAPDGYAGHWVEDHRRRVVVAMASADKPDLGGLPVDVIRVAHSKRELERTAEELRSQADERSILAVDVNLPENRVEVGFDPEIVRGDIAVEGFEEIAIGGSLVSATKANPGCSDYSHCAIGASGARLWSSAGGFCTLGAVLTPNNPTLKHNHYIVSAGHCNGAGPGTGPNSTQMWGVVDGNTGHNSESFHGNTYRNFHRQNLFDMGMWGLSDPKDYGSSTLVSAFGLQTSRRVIGEIGPLTTGNDLVCTFGGASGTVKCGRITSTSCNPPTAPSAGEYFCTSQYFMSNGDSGGPMITSEHDYYTPYVVGVLQGEYQSCSICVRRDAYTSFNQLWWNEGGGPNTPQGNSFWRFKTFAHQAEHFVERSYSEILGRTSDSAGLTYWSGIADNACSVTHLEWVADFFYDSTEYANRNLSRRQKIETYYRGILGREPDTAGLDYWDQSPYSLGVIKDVFWGSAEAYLRAHSGTPGGYESTPLCFEFG